MVIDTNVVLDVWVFEDPQAASLRLALAAGRLRWLATAAMRDELRRVLGYTQILRSLAYHQRSAASVLQQFDVHAQLMPAAAKAPLTCKDADDQKFIDLALAQRCLLLSKDRAVLCLAKRLRALGVPVQAHWWAPSD
ncbi:MAG: PIN domain-containing protein [Rhodoferax sp.]